MEGNGKKKVVVIGGGVAGMEAASQLTRMGYDTTIVEKQARTGGNVANWDHLFPEGRPAGELVLSMYNNLSGTKVITGNSVKRTDILEGQYILTLADGTVLTTDALLVASGFRTFDAHRKEEYGYGIYDRVYTSADLEQMLNENQPLFPKNDRGPKKVAFVHCVGSRDEKVGNRYCSKTCCAMAVKQASRVKELYPDAEVFCFYMDLRMFDRRYEQMYLDAQAKYGVNFIRGRLSEAAEDMQRHIVLKAEDTLMGKPLKMTVDMLVLMVGMEPASGTKSVSEMLKLPLGHDGFFVSTDELLGANRSQCEGIFLAGTCTGPKTIPETVADARSAATMIDAYLRSK